MVVILGGTGDTMSQKAQGGFLDADNVLSLDPGTGHTGVFNGCENSSSRARNDIGIFLYTFYSSIKG